jgi:hypothetical protein
MAGAQSTWLDAVDEMIAGDKIIFEEGEEKILKIVSNPVAGPIEFRQSDGSTKMNDGLKFVVLEGENPKIKTWAVTAKGLMQQIKAVAIANGIGVNIAGSILRVTASGQGMQRKYFVKLLERPARAEDKGSNWLEGQKADAK